MITLITELPDHVVGLLADGQVTRQDYAAVVTPALKAALERHDKVSIYYELSPSFTGIDFGAGLEDFFLGITHLLRWKRIAIVTDIEWMKASASFFGHMIPADIGTFSVSERDSARAWVTQ